MLRLKYFIEWEVLSVQHYFYYIVAINTIDGENWGTKRKTTNATSH
jgi:hypothetical protein